MKIVVWHARGALGVFHLPRVPCRGETVVLHDEIFDVLRVETDLTSGDIYVRVSEP